MENSMSILIIQVPSSMWIKCKLLWLMAFSIAICAGEDEAVIETSTYLSREILEKQALRAYENACFGLQELSNWMSVVLKMKSVWASSTINQMGASSRRALDNGPSLPQRPKTGLECSLQNVQVTLQTYAHLQGQLLHLKGILGRNVMKASTVKLGSFDATIRERIKVLDVFNETLSNVFSKLWQSTKEFSSAVGSNKNWQNVIGGFQEGRALQYFQIPTNILQTGIVKEEIKSSEHPQSQRKRFFQTVGKFLDTIIFPSERLNSKEKITNVEHAATVSLEDTKNNIVYEKVEENFEV